MKIAHITYGLKFGGIETMLVNIANEQQALGNQVHIIVINDLVEEQLAGRLSPEVALHRLNRKVASKNPLVIMKFNILLSKINPDVIHLHYATISRYILLRGLKRKLCVTLHAMCSDLNIVNIDKSGPIFAISNMVKDDIQRRLGLESTTVCNGVNLDLIAQKENVHSYKKRFEIVQVSRLVTSQKGQDILVKAVAILKRKGVENLHLSFIGDGESRQELEELVIREGIGEDVTFLGTRTQEYIFEHLRDYDLFVQPSRWEGFGLTVAEAMAAKVPVIVSDNQAPMEVIDYGRYGLAFKGGDAADCAAKIETAMQPGYREKIVDRAWTYVNDNFNIKKTALDYLNYYSEKIVNDNVDE